MERILCLALMLCVWSPYLAVIAAADVVNEPNAAVEVTRLLAQGAFARALEVVDEALRHDPQGADLHWLYGAACLAIGDSETALDALLRAVRLDRQQFDTYVNRAIIWHDQGKLPEAIADYTAALRMGRQPFWCHYNRGTAWGQSGNYDRAIADFDAAIRLQPNDAGAYGARGYFRHLNRQYDQAAADYSKAIQLAPNDAVHYSRRADLWFARNELEKALADYDQTLRLDPRNWNAFSDRGRLHLEMGRYEEALSDLNAAIHLNPGATEEYGRRGFVQQTLEHFESAIADYGFAVDHGQVEVWIYVNRAQCLYATKDFSKSIADYTRAINLGGNNADAWCGRGDAYMHVDKLTEAVADYTAAIRLEPDESRHYHARGTAWTLLRKKELARADFQTAIALAKAAEAKESQTVASLADTLDPDLVIERFGFDPHDDWIVLPVVVDGRLFSFVLDTGCSFTVLDSSLLGEPKERTTMKLASGRVVLATLHSPPAMSLGRCDLQPMLSQVTGQDLGAIRELFGLPIYGFIGMDLLRQMTLRVDFDRGEVVMLSAAIPTIAEVNLWFSHDRRPRLKAELADSTETMFVLDTGCVSIGAVSPATARDFVTRHGFSKEGRASSVDMTGAETTGKLVCGPLLRLGHAVGFDPNFVEGVGNLLGLAFVRCFNVTFDFPNARMYLEPRHESKSTEHRMAAYASVLHARDRESGPAKKDGLSKTPSLRPGDIAVSLADHRTARRRANRQFAHYDRIIKADPTSADAYLNRGIAWQAQGEYENAVADLDRAIHLDPECDTAYGWRADAWRYLGDLDRAMADYRVARRMNAADANLLTSGDDFWQLAARYVKAPQPQRTATANKQSRRPQRIVRRWSRR